MAALTYYTAKLYYPAITADDASDPDYDPQIYGTMAGAMITAHVVNTPPVGDDIRADEIPAGSLTPEAAMVTLAPIDCRLNGGHLCLRSGPDLVVHSYTSAAAFPAIGLTTQLYWAADVDKTYKWAGGYLEVASFRPVRLVADTDVLGLPPDAFLAYTIEFDHVRYGGQDRELPGFSWKAPSSDVVLDLATAERVTL